MSLKQSKSHARAKRRRLNPDERRTELLEAAIRVLQAKGPDEARVEDVTGEAGAAKGTFYLYFVSWEDLLFEVRAHLVTNYVTEMRSRFTDAARSDCWAAFENECLFFVDYIVELGDLHRAVFHGPIADKPMDSSMSSAAIIAWMLGMGIDAGVCRPVQIEIAAPLVFSVLHAAADGIADFGDRKRRIDCLMDLLRRWLRAPD